MKNIRLTLATTALAALLVGCGAGDTVGSVGTVLPAAQASESGTTPAGGEGASATAGSGAGASSGGGQPPSGAPLVTGPLPATSPGGPGSPAVLPDPGSGAPGATIAQVAAANVVRITEAEGVSTTDYPVQIGRVFARGEITAYPAAIVDGTPVQTQAEVKTRWDDGSAKHAVLSFHVPRLQARQQVRVTFGNQPGGNNDGALTASQMLDARFGFDARIELSASARTVAASARQMLADGRFQRWLSGPIATSVVLADHSLARAYDLGFDANRTFRPIVHATFWPRINKVFVRVIGEVSQAGALQTMDYDLRVAGGTANTTVYAKTGVAHGIGARWTRTFWLGGAPSRVSIDNNLAYLAASRAVPNFDAGIVVSPQTVSTAVARASAQRGVFESGDWYPDMGGTGGRPDIGMFPSWDVQWLYTGDARAREVALSNSDLAGAWPVHFRESTDGRFFDPARAAPALGRPVSLYARPTLVTTQLDNPYTAVPDRLVAVGTVRSSAPWNPDMAHQPDPFTVPYLLTGEFWYLEQLQFWAAWGAMSTVHGSDISWGRGPYHWSGNIQNQPRGQGWGLRTRVHAAWYSPDGSPEKAYFEKLTRDVIAIWEGKRRIRGTAFENSTEWNWGWWSATEGWNSAGDLTARGFWDFGDTAHVGNATLLPGAAATTSAPFAQGMLMIGLGRALELGYPAAALVDSTATYYTQTLDGGNGFHFMSSYVMPIVSGTTRRIFGSWSAVRAAFSPGFDATAVFNQKMTDLDHGYSQIACAGVASIRPSSARDALYQQCVDARRAVDMSVDPKWALVPR